MTNFSVRILPAAWQDIDRISDHYLSRAGAAAAQRITDKLLDAAADLGKFPYMGALHPDPVLARMEYRKLICEDYVCVYRVVENTVYLYRIVHGATDYPSLFR